MEKITLRIKSGRLKEAKSKKRYPITYGKPIVDINSDMVERLAEEIQGGKDGSNNL